MGAPDLAEPRAAGVWTLAGDRLIINEPRGPATILVPTEQVRLLEVDLPLASRAKRLSVLPFAIEDQIAEPLEGVHIALGDEVGPKRYMVGVVSHSVMSRWVEIAEEAGLGHAAIVPDAISLPIVAEDEWWVDIQLERALVRTQDGGFACPVAMLRAAWEAAGKPDFVYSGDAPPAGMPSVGEGESPAGRLADLLAKPRLDLRQGIYARRATGSNLWRRLGWIVALGATAHIVIAAADTLMLRSIADRRAAETRALIATTSPGVTIGSDLVGEVTDLLPAPSNARPDAFMPLVARLSGALAPVAGSLTVRAMNFQANTLTMDVEGSDPGLAARVDAALKASRIEGRVIAAPDGSVRITASGA
ncbi:MAG: general secretion pathway protein GspL [Sphingomonadales bacterium]|nr:MAG: general secretion pathway protein GspL [Sphingomonadales bacterium]